MTDSITFETFGDFFDKLNSAELVDDELKNQFYELIPLLFHYEEEGEKLNFNIIFIRNFEQNKKLLPSFIFQKIITVNKNKLNLRKSIKSIAPFSKNGWNIFVSISENFEFGVYKNLSGLDSIEIKNILKSNDFFQVDKIDNSKLLFLNADIDFLLHIAITKETQEFNKKENIKKLVKFFTNKITNEHKDKFTANVSNVLFHNFDKIHGTILCIQDNNIEIDDFLKKGIFFEKPINLFDEYLNFISNCSAEENIAERYYSFIGILSIILNIDGLTLINDNGEILGYNIFIDNREVDTSVVSGGARKRAAYSVEHSKVNGLIGIYFQSHDGDNYFKEIANGQ